MKKITMLVALSILLTMLIGQVPAMGERVLIGYGPTYRLYEDTETGELWKVHDTVEDQEDDAEAFRRLQNGH